MVAHEVYIKPGDVLTVRVSDTNARSTTAPRNNNNNNTDNNNYNRPNLSGNGWTVKAPKNRKANRTRKASGGKRALSGYMKFCRKMRPEILRSNPGIEFGAVGKLLGGEWNKLSEAEKKKF